jgi:hypothetical protein
MRYLELVAFIVSTPCRDQDVSWLVAAMPMVDAAALFFARHRSSYWDAAYSGRNRTVTHQKMNHANSRWIFAAKRTDLKVHTLTTLAIPAVSMVCLPLAMSGTRVLASSAPGAALAPAVPVPGGDFVRRVTHTWHCDSVKGGAQEPAVSAIFGEGPVNLERADPQKPILAGSVMSTCRAVDRMPRDGHSQQVLHSLGGQLCGS